MIFVKGFVSRFCLILGVLVMSLVSSHCSNKNSPSPSPSLRQKIGQMIVIGFEGTKPSDSQVQKLSDYIENGLVGGVIYFGYNIESPEQVKTLTSHFKGLKSLLPLLQCVDQEGGRVQRLNSKNGFQDTKAAFEIGSTMTPQVSRQVYGKMSKMVANAGFNVIFGPVVDLHANPYDPADIQKPNPVIGGLKRAYSPHPDKITTYAKTFIEAARDHGILTSLKHFPGHGLAPSDTHHDLTDVTETFQPALELQPYKDLVTSGHVDMVMTAHVVNRTLDENNPATLSPVIIKTLLRQNIGYDGVVITDDLFMGAIQKHYDLKETIIKAIQADVDLLLVSINHAAQKGVNPEDIKPIDGKVIEDIIAIVEQAIQDGLITEQRIDKSFNRIMILKAKLGERQPTHKEVETRIAR